MTDWERVLKNWQLRGRTGLTIQALATICKRSPKELLNEMFITGSVYSLYCGVVQAPVLYSGGGGDSMYFDQKAINTSLQRWPWPKYKGIMSGQGLRTLRVRNPKNLLVEPRTYKARFGGP